MFWAEGEVVVESACMSSSKRLLLHQDLLETLRQWSLLEGDQGWLLCCWRSLIVLQCQVILNAVQSYVRV